MIDDDRTTPVRRPRMVTIIWGALVLIAGIGILAWSAGQRFDLALVGSAVLGLAGLALILNAIVGAFRSR